MPCDMHMHVLVLNNVIVPFCDERAALILMVLQAICGLKAGLTFCGADLHGSMRLLCLAYPITTQIF